MNIWYDLMVLEYKIRDRFNKPGAILNQFVIKPGFTIVDYGCGPGRYLDTAAFLVGEKGLVYAADISEVGLEHAKKRIATKGLKNIIPILLEPGEKTIPDACADIVYALDMFHLVDDPAPFFENVHRLAKKDCLFYLEDGHQLRAETLKKIGTTDLWTVKAQNDDYVTLQAK